MKWYMDDCSIRIAVLKYDTKDWWTVVPTWKKQFLWRTLLHSWVLLLKQSVIYVENWGSSRIFLTLREKGLEIFQGLFYLLSRTLHLKSEFQWEYKQEPFYNGHTCKSENISLPTLSLTEFMRKSNVNLMQLEYDSAYNSQISLRAVSIQVCTFAEKYIMLWL